MTLTMSSTWEKLSSRLKSRSTPKSGDGEYEYSPLEHPDSDIRILTLLPGSEHEGIHILIKHKKLIPSKRIPDYEALSYVWGSDKKPDTVYVGKDRRHPLKITRSLRDALLHLRDEKSQGNWWIDAICINQASSSERSQQVLRMADIYRLAPRARVWLGTGNEHSDRAMGLLRHLNTMVETDLARESMLPSVAARTRGEEHWADRERMLPYSEQDVTALLDLFGRSWWRRLWVVQEIWAAGDKATLTCGKQTIAWLDLRQVVLALRSRVPGHGLISQMDLDNMLDLVYNLCFEVTIPSLLSLIRATRERECADDRDRVYGISSLIRACSDVDVRVDYTKKPHEVFLDFASCWVNQAHGLDLLRCCHWADRDPGLPLWVPNLARATTASLLPLFDASGRSRDAAAIVDQTTLKVAGRRLATVKDVQRMEISRDSTWEEVIAAIRRVAPPNLDEDYAAGGKVLDAFCRTLLLGLFSDCAWPPDPQLLDFEEGKSALHDILAGSHNLMTHEHFLGSARFWLANRTFFTTEEGFMGMGPPALNPGDQVCVFLGCGQLILLRPHSSQSKRYELVGEAYLHGFNHGEGLLGPLPGEFRAVEHSDNEGNRYLGFVNMETGEWQPTDPRRGDLPQGWRRMQHSEDKLYDVWINEETGKYTVFDPRLTLEELVKQGVKLKDFYIV